MAQPLFECLNVECDSVGQTFARLWMMEPLESILCLLVLPSCGETGGTVWHQGEHYREGDEVTKAGKGQEVPVGGTACQVGCQNSRTKRYLYRKIIRIILQIIDT